MAGILLLRHAAVEPERAAHPALWPLSDAGRQAAQTLASQEQLWEPVQRIFSSPELKAAETAHIIAGPNGITVTLVEDLREVQRVIGQWFDDYPAAVRRYFATPHTAVHGWEPAAQAQARMVACVERLARAEPAPFAIAGHGLTLSLYVAAVTGEDPSTLWPGIGMPDVAIIDPDGRRLTRRFGRP